MPSPERMKECYAVALNDIYTRSIERAMRIRTNCCNFREGVKKDVFYDAGVARCVKSLIIWGAELEAWMLQYVLNFKRPDSVVRRRKPGTPPP
jgi:hypothetical protein